METVPPGETHQVSLTLRRGMTLAVHLREALAIAGRFPVLAGVDLDVERGEVLLVMGPNGAGKTSLLRACAGLLQLSSGVGVVLGHDLRSDLRPLRRRVGLLGHGSSLYEELTVAENVRFAVKASGGRAGAVGEALERVGLSARTQRTTLGRCSAGQRRRANLAVLVARSPELWLLDEPHAGLDHEGRSLLDDLISELPESGATVVIASHEPERLVDLASRSVVIVGGRAVSSETLGLPETQLERLADVAPTPGEPAHVA